MLLLITEVLKGCNGLMYCFDNDFNYLNFSLTSEQKCLDEGGWTNYGISDKS